MRNFLRDFRGAVHHNDEDIVGDKIRAGASYIPLPRFEEIDEDELKVWKIERIELGGHSIFFRDLARWLAELRACAEAVSDAAYDDAPAAGALEAQAAPRR